MASNEFIDLLSKLMSQDNTVRQQAEEVYDRVSIPERCQHLLAVCRHGATPEVHALAAVLLRRILFKNYEVLAKAITAQDMEQLRTDLLSLVREPSLNVPIRRKMCDVVAEMARNAIDDDGNMMWPHFLNFIFDCVNQEDPFLRECGLTLFASVPHAFGNDQSKYLDMIHGMLLTNLRHPNDEVRLAALKAITSFIMINEKDKVLYKKFEDCIIPIFEVVLKTVQDETDDAALKALVEVAEKNPQYLRSHMEQLFRMCLEIASQESKPSSMRHLAIEALISTAENIPATIRKRAKQYLEPLVRLLLKMMSILEEDENWPFGDTTEDDDDNDEEAVTAESSLDRLACAVGGKSVLPLVLQNVTALLQSPHWNERHAALMAISAVGEGCHAQMTPLLEQVVNAITPFLNDSHPRVQYAACNAIGQMANDFAPKFEEKFHAKIIPSLVNLLGTAYNHPRVQAHAGAALVNFFEEAEPNIVVPYMPDIVEKIDAVMKTKIQELMERGTKLVLEQVVVTLAALADSAQENFAPYYDRFMPYLKYIIENSDTNELKLLRGKAIECISLIGLAVGAEKFFNDAQQVMELLLKSQTGAVEISYDDPQLNYMISSWARICKIMGPAFHPYLKFVMPPVLRAAAHKVEVALLDETDPDIEGDPDWTVVSLGDQQSFGIKTAGLEEKATACTMIVCYARELKEYFVEYVEECLKILVPMLKFYFHDGVRQSAAEAIPYLLDSAKARGDEYVAQVWRFVFPEFVKAMEHEPERDVLSEILASYAQAVEKLDKRHFTPEDLQQVVKVIDTHIKDHFERQNERMQKRQDEDYDNETEEELVDENEEDVYLLSKICDVIHSLFKVLKEEFLPFFDNILPHFISLSGPERPWQDVQWAICVLDDLIEHSGPASMNYQHIFLPILTREIQSPHPELRQAAAYGFGVMGKCGGVAFAQTCAQSIPLLVSVITAPDSRSEENECSTENAISAVAKILRFNSSMVNLNEMLPLWLSWLPIWVDEEELPQVYEFFCELVRSNNPLIIGPNNENLPRIVAIIAETLARSKISIEHPVGQQMIMILKSIKEHEALAKTVVESLSEPQRMAIANFL